MTEHEKPMELRVFEIERDRFSLMCSRDVAIGECVRVVEAEPVERELARLRAIEALRMSPEDRDALLAEVEREREEMLDLLHESVMAIRSQPPIHALDMLRKHGMLSDD